MKIIHRIVFRTDEVAPPICQALGVKPNPPTIVAIEIVEDSALWRTYRDLKPTFGHMDMERTAFSRQELDAAPVLELLGAGPIGYPEPSGDFGYRKITYDATDHCETCGLGLKQVRPFMLARPPLIRKRSAFQLHWVDDAFFVREDVWKTVFAPFGIGRLPVLYSKARTAVEGVVQLVIEERVTLPTHGLARRLCELCGRWKYVPIRRGACPSPERWAGHMALSDIVFGHGAAASRASFVSAALYAAIERHGVRDFTFKVAGAMAPALSMHSQEHER